MERIDKKVLEECMHDSRFLIVFTDYDQFKEIREGELLSPLSLYNEVYNIDDVFQDKTYVVVLSKKLLTIYTPTPVVYDDNPQGKYQKNTDDFDEWLVEPSEPIDVEPIFYYVRS